MKVYFTASSVAPSTYSAPEIPQWVSEMGLEWLYLLVASGHLKGTARS